MLYSPENTEFRITGSIVYFCIIILLFFLYNKKDNQAYLLLILFVSWGTYIYYNIMYFTTWERLENVGEEPIEPDNDKRNWIMAFSFMINAILCYFIWRLFTCAGGGYMLAVQICLLFFISPCVFQIMFHIETNLEIKKTWAVTTAIIMTLCNMLFFVMYFKNAEKFKNKLLHPNK